MKKPPFLLTFLVMMMVLLLTKAHSFPVRENAPHGHSTSQENLARMSVRDFEAFSGQDLGFKEKLAFRLLRHQVRKNLRKHPEQASNAVAQLASENKPFEGFSLLAFAFSGLGTIMVFFLSGQGLFVALGGLLFGVISLIRQKRKKGRFNVTSKVLAIFSVVTGIAALGLLVAIIIAFS